MNINGEVDGFHPPPVASLLGRRLPALMLKIALPGSPESHETPDYVKILNICCGNGCNIS